MPRCFTGTVPQLTKRGGRMNMRFDCLAIAMLCWTAYAQPLVPGLHSRNERYRLQPSDIMDVAFRFTPEFNQTVTVQPDGFISLEVAGDLKVAGLTLAEARQAILQKCQ